MVEGLLLLNLLRLRICPTSFTENENLFECAGGLSNVDSSFKSTVILGSGPKVWTPNTHLNIVAHFINLTQQDSVPYHTYGTEWAIKFPRPQSVICPWKCSIAHRTRRIHLYTSCVHVPLGQSQWRKKKSKIRSNHVSVCTVWNNKESTDVFL